MSLDCQWKAVCTLAWSGWGLWMGKGYVWYGDPSSQGKVAPEHEGEGGGTVAWGISLEVLISASMQPALQEKWSVPSERVRSDYTPTNSSLHFLLFWCWWRQFVECQSHLWAVYLQHHVQRTWWVPSEKLPCSRGRFSLLKVNVRFEVWTEEEQEWFGDILCYVQSKHAMMKKIWEWKRVVSATRSIWWGERVPAGFISAWWHPRLADLPFSQYGDTPPPVACERCPGSSDLPPLVEQRAQGQEVSARQMTWPRELTLRLPVIDIKMYDYN